MPKSQSTQTRRTLLRGATLALAGGLAGCTSLMGNDSGGSQPEQTGSPSNPNETPTSIQAPTGTSSGGSADTSTPTETSQTDSKRSFPFMHTATGTTEFGVKLQDSPVMGSDDAPVDMYYWSDYLCPFCQTFALDIHPKLAKNAVSDGTLRVVFLQLPNIGENSWPASILAKCVWDQVSDSNPDLFWEWHHAVFEQQGEENSGWADIDKLFKITRNVGIDTKPIRTCINNQQKAIQKDIEAEIKIADREKIQGTPAFVFVNRKTGKSKKITGAQPYSAFKSAVQTIQRG